MLYQDIYTKKRWLFNCRAEEQAVTPRWTRARNVPQGPTSRQHGLDVHRDQTDNSDFARRYSRRGYIRFYDPARRNAPEKPTTRCFYILFFLERSLRDVILCLAHLNARETDGDLLARQRQTKAETLHLSVEAADTDAACLAGAEPDARLRDLVRLLARQAARDFVNAETAHHEQDRLPK